MPKVLIFSHKINIIHMYFRRFCVPIAESDFQCVLKFLKKNEHKNGRYFSFFPNLFFRRQRTGESINLSKTIAFHKDIVTHTEAFQAVYRSKNISLHFLFSQFTNFKIVAYKLCNRKNLFIF